MRIRTSILGLVAVLAFVLAAAPAAPLGAATADIVGGAPAPGSSLDPTGSFFQLHLTPGATATQSFQVTNPNSHPITVRLTGVDGLTQSNTGAVFSNPVGAAPKAVGTWITPRDLEFVLGPKEARNEPFTVHVPIDAGPGVHFGGISAYSPLSPASTTTTQPGFHAQLNTQPARAIGVEVDLPGPAAPNLVVTGAKPVVGGSGVGLDVAIANTGTSYAKGVGEITVDETRTRNDFTINTFVPATAIEFPMDWMTSANVGTYHVHVVLQYDGGRTTKWDGTVTVDDATVAALKNVKVPDEVGTTNPSKGGVDMLSVVAVAVGTVLALALLALLVVWLARRRRSGDGQQRSARRSVESAPAPRRDRDAVAPRRPSRRRDAEPERELTRSERRHQAEGGRGRHRRNRDDEALPRSARRR
jgi:hypothetical protein